MLFAYLNYNMVGNVWIDGDEISGYVWLILIGFAIWIGVPVVNSTFGTSIMTFEVVVRSIVLQGNAAVGGSLAFTGFASYVMFRI
jgi:hypothetical protein